MCSSISTETLPPVAHNPSPTPSPRYYFKSTRQSSERNDAPRRFVLQPGALSEEARLPASLGQLRNYAAARTQWQEGGHSGGPPHEDFADVRLRVDGRLFRYENTKFGVFQLRRSDFVAEV